MISWLLFDRCCLSNVDIVWWPWPFILKRCVCYSRRRDLALLGFMTQKSRINPRLSSAFSSLFCKASVFHLKIFGGKCFLNLKIESFEMLCSVASIIGYLVASTLARIYCSSLRHCLLRYLDNWAWLFLFACMMMLLARLLDLVASRFGYFVNSLLTRFAAAHCALLTLACALVCALTLNWLLRGPAGPQTRLGLTSGRRLDRCWQARIY
jgi:hypothetical protein